MSLSASSSLLHAFATTLYVMTGDGSLDDNKDGERETLVRFVAQFERLIPASTALSRVVDTLATTDDLFKHVMLVHEAHWSAQIGFDAEAIMHAFMGTSVRVPPAVWGPPLWQLLHALADGGGGGGDVRVALKCLTVLLPCGVCRAGLIAWLTARTIEDDDDASALVIELHNHVNRKLGKKIRVLF